MCANATVCIPQHVSGVKDLAMWSNAATVVTGDLQVWEKFTPGCSTTSRCNHPEYVPFFSAQLIEYKGFYEILSPHPALCFPNRENANHINQLWDEWVRFHRLQGYLSSRNDIILAWQIRLCELFCLPHYFQHLVACDTFSSLQLAQQVKTTPHCYFAFDLPIMHPVNHCRWICGRCHSTQTLSNSLKESTPSTVLLVLLAVAQPYS